MSLLLPGQGPEDVHLLLGGLTPLPGLGPTKEEVCQPKLSALLASHEGRKRVGHRGGLPVAPLGAERPVLPLIRLPLGELARRGTGQQFPDGQAQVGR